MMKPFLFLITGLLIATTALAQNAEIDDIKAALAEAETAQERMVLRYELADAYLRVDAEQAEEIGKQAHEAARSLKNNGMAAQAAYLVAKAFERQRDDRNVEIWLRTALQHAKDAGDSDLIIRSVDERSRLAVKDRNYRRAYEINQEAFSYFSQNGTSISDLQKRFETQRTQLERQSKALQQERPVGVSSATSAWKKTKSVRKKTSWNNEQRDSVKTIKPNLKNSSQSQNRSKE
ncbi:MAG: hypothetical protein R2795_14625 [Saprospiraceae bacterium]